MHYYSITKYRHRQMAKPTTGGAAIRVHYSIYARSSSVNALCSSTPAIELLENLIAESEDVALFPHVASYCVSIATSHTRF